MHMLALVKSHEHVCCRYRAAAFRTHFESLGHHLEIRPWSSPSVWWRLIPGLPSGFDAVIIQRKLFSAWQLKLIRRRVRWLIYDFDDSVFLHSSYHPRGQDCPKRLIQFRNMVQTADVVIAGNEYLRDQATAFTDPNKVALIPTCVDVNRYQLAHHANQTRVKLAWIGSFSTIRGLERIRPTLERLGQTVPGLELHVICDRSLPLDHLPVVLRPWSETTEARDLADADIGISWLPDDGWSAGKCGLKLLQYMAAGLPVIANPVGLQPKLVRHGENGFLAETPDEWEVAVKQLARDADLRRRMGIVGRRLVEEEYHVSRGGAAWEDVLGDLLRTPQIRSTSSAGLGEW